jgi:hypothetical protein
MTQMATTIDKAIVAFLASAIALLGHFGIVIPFMTPETQQLIAMVAAPFLVYLIPNKAAA